MNEPTSPQETSSLDGDQHASPSRRDVLRLVAAAAHALCVYLLSGCGDSPDGTGPKITVVTPTPDQSTGSPTETAPVASLTKTDAAPTLSPVAKEGVLVISALEEGSLAEIVGDANATLSVRRWSDILPELAAMDPASLGIDGQQIWVFTDQEDPGGESVSAIVFVAGRRCLVIPLVGPDQYDGFDFQPSNVPGRWVGFASGEDRIAILDTWHLVDSAAGRTPSTALVFQDGSGRLGVLVGNDKGEWDAIPSTECPAIRRYGLNRDWGELGSDQKQLVESLAAHAGRAEYDLGELGTTRQPIDGGTITVDSNRSWLADSAGANWVIASGLEGQVDLFGLPAQSEYKRVSGVGDTWTWLDDEGNGWYWDFETRRPRREALHSFGIIEDIDLEKLEEFVVQAQERGEGGFTGRVFNSRLFSKYITVVLSGGAISELETEAEAEDIIHLLETGEWAQMFAWLEESRVQVLSQVPADFGDRQSAYCTIEGGKKVMYVLHNDNMNSQFWNSPSFYQRTRNLVTVGFRAKWVDDKSAITSIASFPSMRIDEEWAWHIENGKTCSNRILEDHQEGVLVADDGLMVIGYFGESGEWEEYELPNRKQIVKTDGGQIELIEEVLRESGYRFDSIVTTKRHPNPICFLYRDQPGDNDNGFSKSIAEFFANLLDTFWESLPDDSEVRRLWLQANYRYVAKDNSLLAANAASTPLLNRSLWGVRLLYWDRMYRGYDSTDEAIRNIAVVNFFQFFFHELARRLCDLDESGNLGLGFNDPILVERQRIFYRKIAQMLGFKDLSEFENYPPYYY